MDGLPPPANASITQEAAELIEYLDRRGWIITPGFEEKAFRFLLHDIGFLSLLEVVTYGKAQGKPLSGAALYKVWLEEANPGSTDRYAAWFTTWGSSWRRRETSPTPPPPMATR